MRAPGTVFRTALLALLLVTANSRVEATEYAFSTYALGGNAFGAGATPPAGIYVTALSGFYSGKIGTTVQFGGATINAGAHVEGFTSGANLLYVPDRKVLGGNLGLSVTVPAGHLAADAEIGPFSRSIDGWGLGDIVSKAQLGWQSGELAHTAYIQAVAPTGRWQPGFTPIIGLHRPGVDMGWAFTWANKPSKLQVNGVLGVTFNFENTETNYKSGDEFHFEWAIGLECSPGFVIGVVGYDYRQLTGDSGSGALRPFKGSVDAVGVGLSYTTLVDKRPLILGLRHYQEFNAENRWEGNSTLGTATFKW